MTNAPMRDGLTLYGSARSPFLRKVRVLLHEKALPYLWRTDYYEYLQALNPLGKIPVLRTGEGDLIYDSRVICEYLDMIAPAPAMIPSDPAGRLHVKQWEALADGICDATVLIVNERAREISTQRSDAWIKHQQDKVERSLAVACKILGPAAYCHGQSFTLADAALCSALGYVSYRLGHLDWRGELPELAAYMSRMEGRDSVALTRPAHTRVPPSGARPGDETWCH